MNNKKQIRISFRTKVLIRDNFTCKCCGKKGYDRQDNPVKDKVPLDVHHIIDRKEITNGGYIPENGITLCDDCHLKAEKYHITQGKEAVKDFHPNDLFAIINSSKELALTKASSQGINQ